MASTSRIGAREECLVAAPSFGPLARLRRFYGLSQSELAALLGLSGAQLSCLEAGQQAISAAVAARLAPFLPPSKAPPCPVPPPTSPTWAPTR